MADMLSGMNYDYIYNRLLIEVLTNYLQKKESQTSQVSQNEQNTVSSSSTSTKQVNFADIIREVSARYNVDANLVNSVVEVESGFDPLAESPAGAQGLMQLMPETATSLGVSDAFDPQQNIEGGVRFLSQLMNYFDGDIEKVLAGYNAGPGAVDEYGGIPPYQETHTYVQRVMDAYQSAQKEWSV